MNFLATIYLGSFNTFFMFSQTTSSDFRSMAQLMIDAQNKQQQIANEKIEKDLYRLESSLEEVSSKINILVDSNSDLINMVHEVSGSAKIISHLRERINKCEHDITEVSKVVDELRRDYVNRCQLKEERKSLFMSIFSSIGSQGIGWIVSFIAGLSWIGYLSSKDFDAQNQQNPPVQFPDPHNS